MDKNQFIEFETNNPTYIMHTDASNLHIHGARINVNGIQMEIVNKKELSRYLNLPETFLNDSDEKLIQHAIERRQLNKLTEPVEVVIKGKKVLGFRKPNPNHFDFFSMMMENKSFDDAEFTPNYYGLEIRKKYPISIRQDVGDPVDVGFSLKINNFGPKQGVAIRTFVERLACSNGAVIEAPGFTEEISLSKNSLIFNENFILKLINDNLPVLANSISKLTETCLGGKAEKYLKAHQKLLNRSPAQLYGPKNTYWDYWNSLTDSAKSSEHKAILELKAGKLISNFASTNNIYVGVQ